MSRPAHILLVEDNRFDVELMLDAFREAQLGNTIHVCGTGMDALDYIFGRNQYADRKHYPLPDLILLDLKLPGLSGHEVLGEIKATPEIKRIPVVILTSSQEAADRVLSYDLGVNSYLVKPVSFENFLEVVWQTSDYWLVLNVGPPESGQDR
jgi:CheY-like chemotaxis protein